MCAIFKTLLRLYCNAPLDNYMYANLCYERECTADDICETVRSTKLITTFNGYMPQRI